MNNQLKDLADIWYSISAKLTKGCKEYLIDILKVNGNKIDWHNIDLPECVTVNYDGGNHPEYASNCFSRVDSITLEDSKIYLSIEECDEYSIDRINADELYTICDFIETYKEELNLKDYG